MIKVNFSSTEGYEFEQELTADEIRILNDLKPDIYLEGNDYKFINLQYNVEFNSFTVHIEKN